MEEGKILQNIKKVAPKHCDNCGHKYTNEDFNILKAQDSNALLHLKCPNCGNTYVINAFVNNMGFGSQRMPLILDLEDSTEIEKFAESSPVSKDDAIDFYNLINSGEIEKSLLKEDEKEIRKHLESIRRVV